MRQSSEAPTATSPNPLRVAIIVGSTRRGRFGPTVAEWFTRHVDQHDAFDADLVDLAEAGLPMELPDFAAGEAMPATVRILQERLASADAFVVVTPEYNHGYPASLKNALDWAAAAFVAKPVGLVSYGGIAGGTRAVEQLRQVFPEMHAVTMRETVSFPEFWDKFGPDGAPTDPTGVAVAAKALLDQLAWWAGALHSAKTEHPYAA